MAPLSGTKGSLSSIRMKDKFLFSLSPPPLPPRSSSAPQLFPLLISKTFFTISADQPRVPATVGAAREVDGGGVKSSSEFLLHPLFRLTEGKISVLESEQC